MSNQCTKFEVFSFCCSRDISEGLKLKIGDVMWPYSFQG